VATVLLVVVVVVVLATQRMGVRPPLLVVRVAPPVEARAVPLRAVPAAPPVVVVLRAAISSVRVSAPPAV